MTGVVRWALVLEGFASILQLNVPSGHPLALHEVGRDLEVGKPEDVFRELRDIRNIILIHKLAFEKYQFICG